MEGKIFHITKEKLKELQKEYEQLVAFERTKVVGIEAPKVLESEDMNPEFVAYHEDMDSLRLRMDELKHIIEHHQLIKKPAKEKMQCVDVGDTVLIDHHGTKIEFMIVGTLEANPEAGKISNESPVGKALMGHKVGDEVTVNSPEKTKYKIKAINYEIS